jgi:hypothetical protein
LLQLTSKATSSALRWRASHGQQASAAVKPTQAANRDRAVEVGRYRFDCKPAAPIEGRSQHTCL